MQTGAHQRHFNVTFIITVFLMGFSQTRYAVGRSFMKLTMPFIYKLSRSITVSLRACHLFERVLWRHSGRTQNWMTKFCRPFPLPTSSFCTVFYYEYSYSSGCNSAVNNRNLLKNSVTTPKWCQFKQMLNMPAKDRVSLQNQCSNTYFSVGAYHVMWPAPDAHTLGLSKVHYNNWFCCD